MNQSGTTGTERAIALRRGLMSTDSAVRSQALQELIMTRGEPENVVAVPVLLRALAIGLEPQDQILEALRLLGLRRLAKVVDAHMPELIEAARRRLAPPDEDDLDELPALD